MKYIFEGMILQNRAKKKKKKRLEMQSPRPGTSSKPSESAFKLGVQVICSALTCEKQCPKSFNQIYHSA